jgi:zinc D-Ala-D-Ala carboxypeptidase
MMLSQHFMASEFECPCHNKNCDEQKISMDLVAKLEAIRQKHGKPITITSGYRCETHQKDLAEAGYQTAKLSQHLLGNAADITSRDLYELIPLCDEAFEALGIGKTFLHVDTRLDKLRRWTYS